MSQHQTRDKLNLLAPFSRIELKQEFIDRVVRETRSRVRNQSVGVQDPVVERSQARIWRARLGGALAAGVLVAIISYLFFHESAGKAFARVKERVEQTRTVEFKLWMESAPHRKTLIRLLKAGGYRMEHWSGQSITSFLVVDPAQRAMMIGNPEIERVVLIRGLAERLQANPYEHIWQMQRETVTTLPEREFNGIRASAYRAQLRLYADTPGDFMVWTDPATQLPIHMESVPLQRTGKQERIILSDMRFDRNFEPGTFSLEAPAGYDVTTIGQDLLPDPPLDLALMSPELKPGVGLGPVHFGMSRERVIEVLGRPDQLMQSLPTLDYSSRGYSIIFDARQKAKRFHCYSNEIRVLNARAFQGQTSEGIRIGSTREEVEAAYGSPDKLPGKAATDTLVYADLGLRATIFRDRVVELILEIPS